jgi:hypothetical protein
VGDPAFTPNAMPIAMMAMPSTAIMIIPRPESHRHVALAICAPKSLKQSPRHTSP